MLLNLLRILFPGNLYNVNSDLEILINSLLNRKIKRIKQIEPDIKSVVFDEDIELIYWEDVLHGHFSIKFSNNLSFDFGLKYYPIFKCYMISFPGSDLSRLTALRLLYRIHQYEMRTLRV
jgi:hypothetical protein